MTTGPETGAVLLRGLAGLPLIVSNLVGIGAAMVYNYVVNTLWTLRVQV